MTDARGPLTPAAPEDIAETLAFALRFEGRKRRHDADDAMAEIVAKRLVAHLLRANYVIMRKPPAAGHSGIARGHRGEP